MNGNKLSLDGLIFRALLIAIILAVGISFLALLSMEEHHFGSAIYIKPGSYTNYSTGNQSGFVFGIENNEGMDKNYLVQLVAGNEIVKKEWVFVANGETVDTHVVLDLGKEKEPPFKVKAVLSMDGQGQAVFFWIIGKR